MARFARQGFLALVVLLTACSNGRGSLDQQQPTPQTPPPAASAQSSFTIGGTVTGLVGTGLVLQNNGGADLPVASDGSFTFPGTIATGTAYNVTVRTQPAAPAQICSISSGAGTVAASNVTSIAVACGSEPRFTVGGSIAGLAGTGLVLQNNNADDLTLNANGAFTFATPLANSATYSVTVRTQPSGQNCVVNNPTGTIASAAVTNVAVSCATNQFTLGGNVTGLVGSGLVLRVNGGGDLAIVNDGPFAFSAAVANGAAYTVTVHRQPRNPTQVCTLTNATGTIAGANVTNIGVACVTSSFTVGGTVSGLAGTGLVLRLNGANDLPISSNGAFTFTPPLLSGTSYNVLAASHPSNVTQICTVQNADGTVRDANITNVNIVCATQTFVVSGTISGLLGTGLRLRNNGGDEIQVAANATSFAFPSRVASGGRYNVTVPEGGSPSTPTQACTVINGSGTIGSSDINSVAISCSTSNFAIRGVAENVAGTLVLHNNGVDELTLTASGPFAFATAIPSGTTYNVTVAQHPIAQTCTVVDGTGTVGGSDVNVTVRCAAVGFTVGGTVFGLQGQNLTLQNNGADTLAIAANGPFVFPMGLQFGSPYNVTVLTHPNSPPQTCSVTNGVGLIIGAIVTNVEIRCETGGSP